MSPVSVLVARRAALGVSINGTPITNMRSAVWRAGFNIPYPECQVVVPSLPVGFDQDQSIQIVAGNGTNNSVVRFAGRTRDPDYNLDGSITIRGVGQLERAYTYENSDDPTFGGGLFLPDLIGAESGTDAAVVRAVLTLAGVSYTSSNIGGTGVTFGATTLPGGGVAPGLREVFAWPAGDSTTGLYADQGAGMTALEYIQKWDQVSAVHPGSFATAGSISGNSTGAVTAPTGFYRTFETLGGVVYRRLIGGRPRGTAEYIFTEGVDIRIGHIARKFPLANRFMATGYDDGSGSGAERFVMQSSNPYMSSSVKRTAPPISSPMIEKSAENDPGTGMSCEKVARAMEPDLNRIIVIGTFTTGRDEAIGPGATILVQAPGGLPGRLGTGENVMVQGLTGRVDQSGYSVEFEILGGGVPDNYLPAVPQ